MTKKTLLVLASTFPRWENDTEPRFVYDLCQGLKQQFNIIVLTSHVTGSQRYEKMQGITVYRYRYAPFNLQNLVYHGGIASNLKKNKLKFLLLPVFFISQFYWILKLTKQSPISLIHAHWLIPQGFLALLAMKCMSHPPKLLCTSHGGDLFGLNDRLSIKIKQWVLKNADAISVVSSPMLNKVLQLAPNSEKKLSVIPMGTDLTHCFVENPQIIRDNNMLLFSGRLVKQKGVYELLSIFPMVRQLFPEIQLIIIGDGPEKEGLKKLSKQLGVSQFTHFTGRISHLELSKWYSKATLSVFPFQKPEGFGLVLVEALGCGCPVIVADVPAIHDVIEHNKTGIITEKNNSSLLAKNIIQLLLSPKKCQQLATNGRKYVIKNFSSDKSKQGYIDVINHLLFEKTD